jgi:hypothetical protein
MSIRKCFLKPYLHSCSIAMAYSGSANIVLNGVITKENTHAKCLHYQFNFLSVMQDIQFIGGKATRMMK